MRRYFYLFTFFVLAGLSSHAQRITTGALLEEMIDLERLTNYTTDEYKTVQYSSYDRKSSSPTNPGWFSNGDGFGSEVIPSFEKVLQQPDSAGGVGHYLICDIKQPGAIVRLWTARIGGRIKLYLDGKSKPVFEGASEEFFWRFIDKFSANKVDYKGTFRQVDAVYFPITFAKGCRIEWIGSLKETHFYHVNVRLYKPGTKVNTFKPEDLSTYASTFAKVNKVLSNPDSSATYTTAQPELINTQIAANSRKEIFSATGAKAIEWFWLKITPNTDQFIQRKTILHIYFDSSSVAQVQTPVGDFFGAAPGINSYQSLPFSVMPDGSMLCRFIMPFKKAVRIEIENTSNQNINLSTGIRLKPYNWVDGKSMHFRAHWRINHGITATNRLYPQDIPFLMAFGQGRIVGAASYMFNPGPIPSAGGSWWGEGDEKIYIDKDKFPSFYGTGSEDYYNYSWSSNKIFYYPYCGQPRNDGPANRGFVTNFRWHVIDDIPFQDKLSFSMELIHHEVLLPNFSYGRMVYLYALPGYVNDLMHITKEDVREIETPVWSPAARNRTTGYRFVEAEQLVKMDKNVTVQEGYIWSGHKILMWTPTRKGERLTLKVPDLNAKTNPDLTFMLASLPGGGKVSVYYNGKQIKLSGQLVTDLYNPYRTMLDTYKTERIPLNASNSELVLQYEGDGANNKIGIDFMWIKD